MKRTSPALPLSLLLALLLLSGQCAALWHQTHVDQHPAGDLCSFCLQASDLVSPVSNDIPFLAPAVISRPLLLSDTPRTFIQPAIRPRPARGPPPFS